MCGVRISKAVSSCSLLILAVLALAQDYGAARRQLIDAAGSPDKEAQIIKGLADGTLPADLKASVAAYLAEVPDQRVDELNEIKERLELYALTQKAAPPATVLQEAKKIKSSPLYRDTGVEESSNWISRALENIAKLFERARLPETDTPNIRPPSVGSLNWLMFTDWGLLGALVLAFVFFAVRHFRWQGRLKRKVRTLLEDDEPDRSADEWLAMADSLIAEGQFREAVRCLYLACLIKFDEHGVARFDRGQTNWEHLHRIHSSPTRPPGLDFEPATQAFDRVWYGFHVNGMADVDQFKSWYRFVTEAVRRKAA